MTCKTCGDRPRYIPPSGRVSSRCRECNSAAATAWNLAHPERHAATSRKWVAANREHLLGYLSAWRVANPEARLAIEARRRADHPEAIRVAARKWRLAHPEREIEKAHRRRALKFASFVEDVRRSVVWDRDAGLCHICHQAADPQSWHLEHIVPLIRGGEHSYANTAIAHPTCNLRKGTRLTDWLYPA